MKVILAHEFYRSSAPSGEDAVFRNELNMLKSSNLDISTYEIYNDDIDASTIFKQLSLGIKTIWSRDSYRSVSRILKQRKPDLFHVHNTFPLLSPSIYHACADNHVPVVQTLHNFRMICPGALLQRNNRPCEDCITGSLYNSVKHRCYRDSLLATLPLSLMIAYNRLAGSYHKVSRYIALTKFAASRMIMAGFPEDKIVIKPNFLPTPPERIRDKSNYIVFVGRISEEKGVRTMLRAWKALRHIPLEVLGDGPLRDDMERYSRKHDLPVHFHGSIPRDEVQAIVSKARAMLIPSEWYEGFPMVILEAFANGTPVVASKIGSLDELIIDGKTGFKFEPGNAAQLCAMIEKLYDSDTKHSQLCDNARKTFEENYTEQQNLHYITDIYNNIVSNQTL